MADLLWEMIQRDRETHSGVFVTWNKQPDELTPNELQQALQLAFELAQTQVAMELEPPQFSSVYTHARPCFGFRSIADVTCTPLPFELQTWERNIHDTMHHIILDMHAPLLFHQHQIDELLRREAEWEPFELLTFLNATSRHFTGRERFMMMPEYTTPNEQQINRLQNIYTRKPALHLQIVGSLFCAICYEGPSVHSTSCTCPLCAHLASLTSPSAELVELLASFQRIATPSVSPTL